VRTRVRRLSSLLAPAAFAALAAAGAEAQPVAIDPVEFDRWMYPFNGTPGIRPSAPVFGAVGTAGFDNRDGQLLIAGNTVAAGIPSGLGAANYEILSVRVTVTHSIGPIFYDPTYDVWQSYLPVGNPARVNDTDAGRPLELYGIGLRNGFTSLSLGPAAPGTPAFEEYESFGPGGVGVRNAFPLAFGVADPAGDVSNNVLHPTLASGFDPVPWAIGLTTSGLAPGAAVPQGVPGVSPGETFQFQVNVNNPSIRAYIQQGLHAGVLGFAVTSLYESAQTGGSNPNFYTADSTDAAAVAPTIEISANWTRCSDGIDNDGDGRTDFPSDVGCKDAAWKFEQPKCQDGIDNESDGKIDFDGGASLNGGVPIGTPDPHCKTAWRNNEKACGLGFELAVIVPVIAALRKRRRRA
jgi:hypothetical protein